MLSPESGPGNDYERGGDDVRYYAATQFDKGARAFAFCCAIVYAVLSASLILAIVRLTLKL